MAVVAGNYINAGVVRAGFARYTTTGSLDVTFGVGVTQTVLIDTACNAQAVLIQPADQKIVYAGSSINSSNTLRSLIVRLTTTGNLDLTFAGGRGSLNLGQHNQANTIAIDASIIF